MVSPNPHHSRQPSTVEAHDHLLRAVTDLRALGGEVNITIGGKPVGRFIPFDAATDSTALAEAIDFIEKFGNHHTLGADLDWKSLRDEGRR